MKVSHAVIAIVGILAAVGGYTAIKSKREYDQLGHDIQKTIEDYRAKGIATNGTEYSKPVPNSENAWVDLKPLVLGADYKPAPVNTDDVMDVIKHNQERQFHLSTYMETKLVRGSDHSDLDLVRRVYQVNEPTRQKIVAALEAKPKVEIPKDLDDPARDHHDERDALQAVIIDLSFAAFKAGLDGNAGEVKRYLSQVLRLTNSYTANADWVDFLVGQTVRHRLVQAALRIVEVSPQMLDAVNEVWQSQAALPNLISVNCFTLSS